ncbi:hypothetical protein LV476_02585 [Guyparkeria hydrothermalis]|uniref:hypothetical protein n=1 Tax=Guyparkeria hydrothermalis TaxID=923 RepID=UPI002020B628|nr:hypothetical protein [Guyparkeria hydrothermalis]MCL7743840.1 hypothetical protein [Guyparkeria hydrothermalis]
MPDVSSQVAAAHLEFIEPISSALPARSPTVAQREAAEFMIAHYRENGWAGLCDAVDARLANRAFDAASLDDEDRMILETIDRAAVEPGWLDRVVAEAEAEAADQLAALILAATWGEHEALAALDEMRDAAQAAGIPDSTAHAFIAMVEGERRPDALIAAHPSAQSGLLEATLNALTRREGDADG